MRMNDRITREEARQQLMNAVAANDTEAFANAFNQMLEVVEQDIRQEYEQRIDAVQEDADRRVLAARGVRQLTSEEATYYQSLTQALGSENPRQAIENLNMALPQTVVNSVFEDLRTNHPLLSVINFLPAAGAVQMIVNTDGYQQAAWGELCDEIVKELTSGFKAIDTGLKKLSAFLPVCKAMLDLGYEWLDRYVREVLYEAFANGLEYGIVAGDGKAAPIGMIRDVSEGVSVVGGAYPQKEAIAVTELSPLTIGGIVSTLAVSPAGKARPIRNVIFLVNPVDYFTKVMPATTLQAPDGSYRNDVMPYPMTIMQSAAVPEGKAVIGIANMYFAVAGTNKQGRIEYSDHAKFLEDKRVYLIKGYANGMPKDDNAFAVLDISGLKPAVWKVQMVDAANAEA